MIDPNLIIKIVWTIISAMGFAFALKSLFDKYEFRKTFLKPTSSALRKLELTRAIVAMAFWCAILFVLLVLGAFALTIPNRTPGVIQHTTIIFYAILIAIDFIPVVAVVYDLWADTERTRIIRAESILNDKTIG